VFEVKSNEQLAPKLHRIVVAAPRVAKARKPGQFVIVRHHEGAERIPLTIADADVEAGTITLIVQAVGASTRAIVDTPTGGAIRDVAGPLGKPTELEDWPVVACIGGGVGTAVLYPLAKALAERGSKVHVVIGARSADLVILAGELSGFAEDVHITTEDGSAGREGLVTAVLGDMIAGRLPRPDAVFAVGPVPMMAAVSEMTREAGIKTIVSLNPIMIDGTGMCGGCRVSVGGETKFACVDGPEFDGHKVDFKALQQRLGMYRRHERDAAAHADACRIGLDKPDESEAGQ
jgi:ferredoxin--NADP+ reductase